MTERRPKSNSPFLELDTLNEDILLRVIDLLDPDTKAALKLVNKRYLNLCRRSHTSETVFHLQGNTNKLFRKGLERLLCVEKRKFKTLKVSKFDLYEAFDENFEGDTTNEDNKLIFGKTWAQLIEECRIRDSITSLEFHECILTDLSLVRFRALVKNMDNLVISRCCFKIDRFRADYRLNVYLAKNTPKPITALISVPMISNDTQLAANWVISYCGIVKKLTFKNSNLSLKRPVLKRYYRKYKTSFGRRQRGLEEVIGTDTWLEAVNHGTKIQSADTRVFLQAANNLINAPNHGIIGVDQPVPVFRDVLVDDLDDLDDRIDEDDNVDFDDDRIDLDNPYEEYFGDWGE